MGDEMVSKGSGPRGMLKGGGYAATSEIRY